jgi:hypothetical protein
VPLPAIERDRYYSLLLVDLYTYNVYYLGTREDGNGGGNFLIAGPDWRGTKPVGIERVVHLSTSLMFYQFRTQLFSADMDRVKDIPRGYKAHPLSAYLPGKPAGCSNDRPSADRSRHLRPAVLEVHQFLRNFAPRSRLRLLFVQSSPG